MTDALIIDLALGLFLIFSVLSLMVSGIQEWVAQLVSLRASNLRQGIDNLLGDTTAKALYEHGLIKGLYKRGKKAAGPSYIPAKQFTDALFDQLDLNGAGSASGQTLEQFIDAKVTGNDDLKKALKAIAAGTDGKIEALRQGVAAWFDDSMNRVSGWYARKMKWVGLVAAFVVVVVLNADTLRIVDELWHNAALREQLAATAAQVSRDGTPQEVSAALQPQMDSLLAAVPLGWSCPEEAQLSFGDCFLQNFGWTTVPGWLLTVFAVSLGAPFWFDLMGRVARLRASGSKPAPSGES